MITSINQITNLDYTNNLVNALTITTGFIIGLLATVLRKYLMSSINKGLSHKQRFELIVMELSDLLRHCVANLAVLKSINFEKGIPSIMHFEKMKIPDSAIILSKDSLLIIDKKYTGNISKLKLEIRNINIEIDGLLKYRQKEKFDLNFFKDYIDYLIQKHQITIEINLPNAFRSLIKEDNKVLEIIANADKSREITKSILYEKHFA
jgi:hypothetical protein